MSSKAVIKDIVPSGLWNGLTKYKVTFENGKQYTFFAKGDFKFAVGSEIKYEVTNEEYKNARVPLEEYPKEGESNLVKPLVNEVRRSSLIDTYFGYKTHSPEDEQLRLECIKAAANFNQMKTVGADTVIEEAKQFFNFIKQ
jgi:hypothetical protein